MLSFASPTRHNLVTRHESSSRVKDVDFLPESLASMNDDADSTRFFGDHRVSTLHLSRQLYLWYQCPPPVCHVLLARLYHAIDVGR